MAKTYSETSGEHILEDIFLSFQRSGFFFSLRISFHGYYCKTREISISGKREKS